MHDPLRDFLQSAGAPPFEGRARPAPAPSDTAMIAAVLRLVEAIKRTAGLCGAEPIRDLAEAADILLAQLHNGAPPTPQAVALIGTVIDRLQRMLDDFERGEPPEEFLGPLPPSPVKADGMLPLGDAFADLPRLVRDLGRACGKEVALLVADGDARLDRRLLDRLRDPLAQLVRHCVVAGLEAPDDRIAAGKKREGTIRIVATHGSDHLRIEVGDDGRGLDLPEIGADALGSGLVTEAALAGMTPDDLAQLVFSLGVLDESGADRPDLDAVRSAIAAAGGDIFVRSRVGAGSLFTIRLPRALDVARVLIVGAAGARFALPQAAVVEVVALGGRSPHRIERIGNFLLLACRGALLPALDLTAALRLPDADLPEAAERMAAIVRVGGVSFGVLLDAVEDLHEAVVRPRVFPAGTRSVCAGETCLDDGAVAPVLDPAALAALLGPGEGGGARPESPARSEGPARPPTESRRNFARSVSMEWA